MDDIKWYSNRFERLLYKVKKYRLWYKSPVPYVRGTSPLNRPYVRTFPMARHRECA